VSGRAVLLLLVVSALWGVPYLLIKVAVGTGVAPGVLASGRCLVGALVLLPFAWRAGAFNELRGRWRAVAVLGLLDMAVPFVLLGIGEAYVSSGLAGILVASVPLLIAALAWRLVPHERVAGTRLVGLVVGFAGVVLLMGMQVRTGLAQLAGCALVLAASASYAGATLYLRSALADVSPLAAVSGAMIVATAAVSPLAAIETAGRPLPSFDALGLVVALGVFCSALAFHLYYVLVSQVGAAPAALNTYLSPAIAVCAGVAVLGEPLGASIVAGLLLILAGSWLTGGGAPPHRLLIRLAELSPARRRRGRPTRAARDARSADGSAARAALA
jgi:drug/metabolite transporter (DMT)-like permease